MQAKSSLGNNHSRRRQSQIQEKNETIALKGKVACSVDLSEEIHLDVFLSEMHCSIQSSWWWIGGMGIYSDKIWLGGEMTIQ